MTSFTDFPHTAAVDNTIFSVPFVVASRPRKFIGDRRKQEEERVRNQYVVVRVHQEQYGQDCVANSC